MSVLLIDAVNIRSGGGITHLKNVLNLVSSKSKFEKIYLLGSHVLLDNICNPNINIIKVHRSSFENSGFTLIFWYLFIFKSELKKIQPDVIFVPGGTFLYRYHSVVTMSRNMLPINFQEALRYGFSIMTLRLFLIRIFTRRSFKNSRGFIFLTPSTKDSFKEIGLHKNENDFPNWYSIIPHGIDTSFNIIHQQYKIKELFCAENPMRIIYVSIIDVYKHQDILCKAFDTLINKGLNIELFLVGPSYKPSKRKLDLVLNKLSFHTNSKIHLSGNLNVTEQINLYKICDLIIFSSTCENLPNILLEGMRTGLPIACSNHMPMPEVVGNGAVFFNPLSEEEIVEAVEKMYYSYELRRSLSELSFLKSLEYSWSDCAIETFNYLESFINKRTCVE